MFITCKLENGREIMIDFNCVKAIVEISDKACKILWDDDKDYVVVAHPIKDIQRTLNYSKNPKECYV